MGCNFYLKGLYPDGSEVLIGKRSAAGPYCWDCKRTLCAQGEGAIHLGGAKWLKACPECGKSLEDEGWNGAGGRELGFNKLLPALKSGVKTCSSFTWALSRADLLSKRRDVEWPRREDGGPNWVIRDEYGGLFSWDQFLSILLECPIQDMHSIGAEFS